MQGYKLKSEFRRRLLRVHGEITRMIVLDSEDNIPLNCTNLLPALFSLYTYMWCSSWKDMIKRVM